MTPLQITGAALGLLTGVVTATIAVETRYEKAADAAVAHEQLAAENEADRLRVSLELIKLRIEKFRELATVRPLSESEQIELRAAEKERDIILERLAAKG